jgi:hypothetical protein
MDRTSEMGFKVVTVDNVLEMDPTLEMLAMQTEGGIIRALQPDDFTRHFTAIDLAPQVPLEVRRAFLFARNAMCYGYWCYGILTLGSQQMLRVADDALAHALRMRGIEKRASFKERISRLVTLCDIPAEDKIRWDALRNLRNGATHQSFQQIHSPTDAVRLTTVIAELLGRVTWVSSTT